MREKILSLLLVLCLMFTLVACNNNQTNVSSNETDTTSQTEKGNTANASEIGSTNSTNVSETESTENIIKSESDSTSATVNSSRVESTTTKSADNITTNSRSEDNKPTETSTPSTSNKPADTNKSEEPSKPSSSVHIHSYSAATCTTPETCSCGATRGSALGHKWKSATCKSPKTCSVCNLTEGSIGEHTYMNGVCSVCGKPDPSIPVYTDVLIINNSKTISNQTIDKDVYITSTGNATFENVTVTGNIYCYGKLTVKGGTAKNLYAYYWDLGGIKSSCNAWDGTHGLIKGAFKSCGNVVIKDNSLDYAFNKWGKK